MNEEEWRNWTALCTSHGTDKGLRSKVQAGTLKRRGDVQGSGQSGSTHPCTTFIQHGHLTVKYGERGHE